MRKIVNRRIRRQGKGATVVADVSAVVSGNVGGRGRKAAESNRQTIRVVQRNGRTEVTES